MTSAPIAKHEIHDRPGVLSFPPFRLDLVEELWKGKPSARFTPNVDLLVFALHGDVSNADRVDVEIASLTGEPRYVLEDVPFDRQTGEVLIACQRHYEGMFAAGDPIFSVHAVEAGKRRAVGEYVVTHVWR